MSQPQIIQQAEFNPKIKTYILLTVSFFIAITILGIPFLLIWFLGLGQYVSKRYYNNLECQLTQKHLEFKKGVFFKVEKTIPLENIQDLTFIENPILKYLDLRILKIETASSSHPNSSDMKLVGIVGAAEFKREVLSQRDLLKNYFSSSSNAQPSQDNQVLGVLNEIKDILLEMKHSK